MLLKNKKILIFLVIIIVVIITGFWWFNYRQKEAAILNIHSECLEENEIADYPIDEGYAKEARVPKVPLTISVRDKSTSQEKFSFQIDNIEPRGPRPEVLKCGIYVIRKFNYDPQKTKQEPGYKEELWKYRYNGVGEKILLLAEKDISGIFKANFSGDFLVDPNEKYLVLKKGYLGQDDYALVIKDISNLEDLFILQLKEILKEHPDILPGNFGFGTWLENGAYLCGDIFSGALDTAYGCIKVESWEVEIFPSPPDLLAGVERSVDYKSWYLAYVDIPTFVGFEEVYQQIIREAKQEGKQKNLFIYNLRTREKTKITSIDNLEWRFNLKWISDTELEYELPTGEKEIYKIKE